MTVAAPRRRTGLRGILGTYPNAVLLIIQLGGLLIYPFTGDSTPGRTAYSVVQLLVLVVAVAAVRMTPALTWISATIGVPALIFSVLDVPLHDAYWVTVGLDATHAIFYLYTAYALIRYMFSDNEVGADEIYATGACFTVVAWAFAYLYGLVQTVWSGQFTAGTTHHGPLTWIELVFLSFTTMTGTGLSDIYPVGDHARSVAMLEQLAGVNYLGLVVARLLGMTLTRFRKEP
ncbi:ion channel [Allobranchiibius sp. CTAmp26]|uniref:ion channel n=1 Tax=Allobranchiibius sp. CTAmp26 TaxID=2815214 RepID=UPI001AA1629A|nr:ion channel [Allobranchiibius sp. CTAmp26]MBO1755150.1 two pore domain potassium channel family protein [Allobranchiibius sp. CTAmp26]